MILLIVGKFELVAERINDVMTPEFKYNILRLKNEIPDNEKKMGIEIYQAVIRDGIRNYSGFVNWRKQQDQIAIIDWMP